MTVRLRLVAVLAALCCVSQVQAAAEPAPSAGSGRAASGCEQASSAPWPTLAATRRALLRELEALAPSCMTDPNFLGLLGGLWLDEGDAAQALIWLERSLLLQPQALGVRADYAMALAALGEPAARDELLKEFERRSDVPAALLSRLNGRKTVVRAPDAPGSGPGQPRWLHRGELALTQGHETNLDHSPTLSGLTLTAPDGPVELPLAVPIKPRSGSAAMAELGIKTVYEDGADHLWQLTVLGSGRQSRPEPSTDWRSLQVGIDHWRMAAGNRLQLQVMAAGAGGALTESYRIFRAGAALEQDSNGCTWRGGLDHEIRRQAVSSYLDGRTTAAVFGGRCALPGLSPWQVGLVGRLALDQAPEDRRPGGNQLQQSLALRANGRWQGVLLDTQYRWIHSRDAQGYSPLLEGNARRTYRQAQWDLDLSIPLRELGASELEAVVRLSYVDQRSNIVVFVHQGRSAYTGLRLRW